MASDDLDKRSRIVDGQVWITPQKNFAHWTNRKWFTMFGNQRVELEWGSGMAEDPSWYLFSDDYFGIKMSRKLEESMKMAAQWILMGPQW